MHFQQQRTERRVTVPELPTLLIDTREQTPLQFEHLPSVSATLQTADYSVKGLEERLGIERKTWPDINQSVTTGRERFMREMHRFNGYQYKYLLIIGSQMELCKLIQQGRFKLNVVHSSLLSIRAKYGVHILRANTPKQAANMVETLAYCAWRDALKPAGVSLPFPDWISKELIQ